MVASRRNLIIAKQWVWISQSIMVFDRSGDEELIVSKEVVAMRGLERKVSSHHIRPSIDE